MFAGLVPFILLVLLLTLTKTRPSARQVTTSPRTLLPPIWHFVLRASCSTFMSSLSSSVSMCSRMFACGSSSGTKQDISSSKSRRDSRSSATAVDLITSRQSPSHSSGPDGGVAVLVCTPSHSRGARAPYRYWLLKNAIRALPIEILSREAGFTAKRVCKCAIRIRDVFQQVLNNRDPLAANVSIAIDLVEVTEVSHGRGYIGPCQSTWAC